MARVLKKSLVIALLGCVGGFVWAYIDAHPELLAFLSSKGREIADRIPDHVDRPDDGSRPPSNGNASVTNPSNRPIAPRPPEPADEWISPIRKLLAEGKIEEADALVKKTRQEQGLPPLTVSKLNMLQMDIDRYRDLVRESSAGRMLAATTLSKIEMNDGKVVYGRISGSPESKILTCTDVGGNFLLLRKQDVKSTDKVPDETARTLFDEEYQRKYKERIPGKMKAIDYFELADYCITYGINWHVTELLDSAIAHDKNVLETIRKTKGRKLYDAFLYFLAIGKKKEAEETLNILKKRYASIIKIEREDEDLLIALQKKPPQVVNNPVKPTVNDTRKPPNDKTPRLNPPENDQPKQSDPPQPKPPDDEPTPFDRPNPSVNGGANLQPDDPAKVKHQELIDRGNLLFDEGMRHLKASDPQVNPNADKENLAAEKKFKEALNFYEQAQQIADSKWLQGQIRESMSLRSMCRKRAVIMK